MSVWLVAGSFLAGHERTISVFIVLYPVNMLPAVVMLADFISGLVKQLICKCLMGLSLFTLKHNEKHSDYGL